MDSHFHNVLVPGANLEVWLIAWMLPSDHQKITIMLAPYVASIYAQNSLLVLTKKLTAFPFRYLNRVWGNILHVISIFSKIFNKRYSKCIFCHDHTETKACTHKISYIPFHNTVLVVTVIIWEIESAKI